MLELFDNRMFRPPAEAESLIIRVAQGCPHNSCAFCGMYKGVRYCEGTPAEIKAAVQRAVREDPGAGRIFLADGDVMHLPYAVLHELLGQLNAAFPRLTRVSVYANGDSILARTEAELRALQALKLHTLYLGLESGDAAVLKAMHKRDTVDGMVAAAQRAQGCGLRMSVMVLLGLGGREGSARHAELTAAALNRMQPRLLSALRVIPVRGTPLFEEVKAGRFQPVTEYAAVAEMRRLIAGLELTQTVFRANHTSNVIPLEGRLSKDKARLLAGLDALLASGELDTRSPGATPLWL